MRRQAINAELITRQTISTPSLRYITQAGTKGAGAPCRGTISFRKAFAGTPVVILQKIAGSSIWGRTQNLDVISRYSGSFTYKGSPTAVGGTFAWLAYGSG